MSLYRSLESKVIGEIRNILENQGPVLGDEYENDWICLGSDVDSGDGKISEIVEDMLRQILVEYPTIVVYQAWWDSFEGVQAREFLAESIQDDDVKEYLESEGHFDDIYEKAVKQLFSGLSARAEEAYLQWEAQS